MSKETQISFPKHIFWHLCIQGWRFFILKLFSICLQTYTKLIYTGLLIKKALFRAILNHFLLFNHLVTSFWAFLPTICLIMTHDWPESGDLITRHLYFWIYSRVEVSRTRVNLFGVRVDHFTRIFKSPKSSKWSVTQWLTIKYYLNGNNYNLYECDEFSIRRFLSKNGQVQNERS